MCIVTATAGRAVALSSHRHRALPPRPRIAYDCWVGEIAALTSSMLWAVSSVLFGSRSGRVPVTTMSLVRLLAATALLWVVATALFAVGRLDGVSLSDGAALALGGMLGLGLGDTLYFGSLRLIGVARAFPISMAGFPLLTFVLAALFVDEAITLPVLLGSGLIIAGILLIALREEATAASLSTRHAVWGVLLVLAAALLWSIAGVWLVSASAGVSPVLVGAIRIPAAALFTAALARAAGHAVRPGRYGARALLPLAIAGVFGTGVGSLLYVVAVQEAGASRAAILSSTAPLFALPMAALFLRERITRRVAFGTVLSVLGIWLVTLS